MLRNPLSAVWTCIVLLQPRRHARMMEPMLARQHRHLLANVDFVHANTAFSAMFIAQHVFSHVFAGKGVDLVLWGGAGSVTCRRLFHELRDDAVEAFLRVDKVAHLAAAGNQPYAREHLQNWVADNVRFVAVAVVVVVVGLSALHTSRATS